MTLRELLKSLPAVDEKHLDVDVLVSPASGGYSGISHVSVLYVGHAVLHLAEPTPVEPPDLLAVSGEGDFVAAVDPADLKNVWAMFRNSQAQDLERGDGGTTTIDVRGYQRVCSPGANAMAVWYRASMLGMLNMFSEAPLKSWTHDGDFDDAVFQVAATFPMNKMRTSVVYDEPPFDVEGFVKQVGART